MYVYIPGMYIELGIRVITSVEDSRSLCMKSVPFGCGTETNRILLEHVSQVYKQCF